MTSRHYIYVRDRRVDEFWDAERAVATHVKTVVFRHVSRDVELVEIMEVVWIARAFVMPSLGYTQFNTGSTSRGRCSDVTKAWLV